MKNAIYIGNFNFPLGNAAGKRVYANGKLLREIGTEIAYLGLNNETPLNTPILSTKEVYDGFEFYNLPNPRNLFERLRFLKIRKEIFSFLDELRKTKKLDILIYYGSPVLSIVVNSIIKYCKKNKIIVISDCVDWLSVKTNNPFFDIFKCVDTNYRNILVNKKADGVIAISRYLAEYYKNAGCKTVIIPPLSPIKYSKDDFILNSAKKIKICYAGLPFRKGMEIKDPKTLKDRIDLTIDLFLHAKENGCDFAFNIFGFTKEELITALPSYKKKIAELSENIMFHGSKPNEEVTKEVMSSDFTILIRDDKRETRAGFPTKVSESISCGTPVITTKTSDLEDYIIEGRNGFFLNIEPLENSKDEFLEIMKMDKKRIFEMKMECVESEVFYYIKYLNKIDTFLKYFIKENP
jgi:glycosyltransferase involved in cell wall biosynthesis